MVETTSDFDYNRMCLLAAKCDSLFESQLKEVRVIQRLKEDIDFTKRNFHGRLRAAAIEQITALVALVMQRRPDLLDKARTDAVKVVLEGIVNKTFGHSQDVVSRVMERVRENLQPIKMDLSRDPTPQNLSRAVELLREVVITLEDTFSAVAYNFFFMRVLPPD